MLVLGLIKSAGLILELLMCTFILSSRMVTFFLRTEGRVVASSGSKPEQCQCAVPKSS